MNEQLSNEEKRAINRDRQNAVRNAWKEEKNRVERGFGTREWTVSEQKELLESGTVSGYEGHHMKSVNLYPEYAGDPQNIQFLTSDEHLYGAHSGSYHNLTNGYYDPEAHEMHEFGEGLEPVPIHQLPIEEHSETNGNDYSEGQSNEVSMER